MPWRNAQALHIFVPSTQKQENWVEQIVGTVMLPLCGKFGDSIRWMWVTRYVQIGDQLPDSVKAHSNDKPIPDHYLYQGQTFYRYVVFRISTTDNERSQLHQTALSLAESNGFYVVPWVEYDVVGDLGNNRFIYEQASPEERVERARLVANFMDATIRLMLDSLVADGDQWKLETNSDKNNPDGSFFQSMHHLFCNATRVPLYVSVNVEPGEFRNMAFRVPVRF